MVSYQLMQHPLQRQVYDALVLLWPTKTNPDSWKWKWLTLIPKKDKVPNQYGNMRPLMLIEALRKLWVDIALRPIIKAWNDSNLFSRMQHGSTWKRSTYSSIMEVQALIEEAEELTTLLFISSFDFSKAFDSIDPDAIDFCLRRAQTPESIFGTLIPTPE